MRTAVVAAFLLAAVAPSSPAAEAPRLSPEPPASYPSLASLLTPAVEALAAARPLADRSAEGAQSVRLLVETVLRAGEHGLVEARHEIRRPITPTAARDLDRLVLPLRPSAQGPPQRVHVALARVLAPGPAGGDGPDPRSGSAAIEKNDGSYDLVIRFPRLEVGGAVEVVVVLEDPVAPVPGELTALLELAFAEPADRVRHVVELPETWESRLRRTVVDEAGEVGAPERRIVAPDRVRLVWERRDVPARPDEPGGPPLRQRGPVVWLSTAASWEQVAEAFRFRWTGREELTPELARRVEDWTAEARTGDAIVDILSRQVLREGGSAEERVLRLRSYLGRRGIRGYPALLDTVRAGQVETRSPDFRHFDHLVLAIDRGDGRFLWIDPSVPFLAPGSLPPRDAGRDSLVIRDRGYQFVRTPRQSRGVLDLGFDLEPAAEGGWQGRLELVADGYRAAAFRHELAGTPAREWLIPHLRSVFPDAEVTAVETSPDDGAPARFRLRAGFTARRSTSDSCSLSFPPGRGALPEPTAGPRRTSYYRPPGTTRLRLRFALPAGRAPESLPGALVFDRSAAALEASWRAEPGAVTAYVSYEQRRSVVGGDQLAEWDAAIRALDRWLEQPVSLAAGDAAGGFGCAFSAWLAVHGPPWLGFARPTDLEQLRWARKRLRQVMGHGEPAAEDGDLEEALGEDSGYSVPERVKVALLMAGEPELSLTRRLVALAHALHWLRDLAPRYSTSSAMLRAVVDDPRFGFEIRREALELLLLDAVEARDAVAFREALGRPIVDRLDVVRTAHLARLRRFDRALEEGSARVLADRLVEMLVDPLDAFEVELLERFFARLVELGNLDEAARIAAAMSSLRLAIEDPQAAADLRNRIVQQLTLAQQTKPMLEALRSTVLARIDPMAIRKPDFWSDLREKNTVGLMDPEVQRQARLYQVSAGEVSPSEIPFWPARLSAARQPSEVADLALRTIIATARAAPDDRTRSLVLLATADSLDLDDRASFDLLLSSLEPYRDATEHPYSAAVLRLMQLLQLRRTGEETDIEARLAELHGPIVDQITSLIRIQEYLRRREDAGLRRLFASGQVPFPVSSLGVELHLAALGRIGRAEEASRIRQATEVTLYAAILRSWVRPEIEVIVQVLELSRILHDSPVYPAAWWQHVRTAIDRPDYAARVRMLDAELRRDWPTALGQARILIDLLRWDYDVHWDLGRSAYHLGRWEEARDALRVYVDHCHDRLNRDEAVELLAAAEARSGS